MKKAKKQVAEPGIKLPCKKELDALMLAHGKLLQAACDLYNDKKAVQSFMYSVHTAFSQITLEYLDEIPFRVEPICVWVVTCDGTSSGEYEQAACSTIFTSYDQALKFVKREMEDHVINSVFVGKNYTDKQLAYQVKKLCKWYNDNSIQFRYGDSIADYKIEPMRLNPVTEEK